MTKKLLLDFENDICVVFFEHKGRTYTSAFSNKHDLWAFLQQAPTAIRASLEASTARAQYNALKSTNRVDSNEAARLLSALPQHEVKFISQLGVQVRPANNFDPSKLKF